VTDEPPEQAESDDPDRALAQVLTPDALREQVRLRRAEGTYRQCDAALQLLEWYGRLRDATDVAALLAVLDLDQTGRADRHVVVQGAALGRPAVESARIAGLLAARRHEDSGSEDHTRICALVTSFRPARDLTRFVDTLVNARDEALAEAVVIAVAEQREMDTVARLELSLRAAGHSYLASRCVKAALDRRSMASEIAELIDYQSAYGPPLTAESAVSGPVAMHIREQMPQDRLVDFVLRQYRRDPGRALTWSVAVTESERRPITGVVELFAKASANGYTDLAEKITATVAKHRGAQDLLTYAAGAAAEGWDIFDSLFERVSVEASADIISDLMQLWNARPRAKNAQLCRALAEHAPAATLAGAAAHLAARTWHSLADELLRTALEQPQRFEAAEVAILLAGISGGASGPRSRRRGDPIKNVIQKLDTMLSPKPGASIGVPYLARLTCAITETMPDSRAAQARTQIGSALFDKDDHTLPEQYYNALRALGRHDLAEEFRHDEFGTLEWSETTWSAGGRGKRA